MKSPIVFFFSLFLSLSIFGQNDNNTWVNYVKENDGRFEKCAAIFLNNKVLVNDYSPRGKCQAFIGMEGKLVVSEFNQTCGSGIWPIVFLEFKVAIQDTETNTMCMYSEETFYEVELNDVLKKCDKGDKVIILTIDDDYSLPHHEIEITDGC